jgi:transketolase
MTEQSFWQAKQWSRLGSRASFGQAMLYLAGKTQKNLMVLSADLGRSSGLGRFQTDFPDKFVNVGISEQNLIGVAAGLAKEGAVVFATSFSPFIGMRASEQVRMNLGYMDLNVKAVALGAGFSMGFLGNSHYGIEDCAVMRSIPNMTVISPADCGEIFKTVIAASEFDGPMYIRLTGETNNPVVYEQDYDFQIGKAVTLKESDSPDVTLIATGTMVYHSLQAAKILETGGLKVSVVNMHTIKPLDTAAVDKAIRSSKLIVTAEEASVVGGLGSAVAEYKSSFSAAPPQMILGIPDEFGPVGEHLYLLGKYGLTGEGLANTISSKFRNIHPSHFRGLHPT